ncbi:hypothetical protein Tco_1086455, partial [Tanacetum coccineum]
VKEDPKEDIPPIVASPLGSLPISPPPLSESSSNSDSAALVTADRTFWVPPPGSTFEATTIVEDDVLALQARAETAEARQLQAEQERASDREEIQRGTIEAHPSERIDVLAVYGDARFSESQGPPDGSLTMPPRRLRQRVVERLVTNRVAKVIAEYKRNRVNLGGTGGVGGARAGNAGGNIAPEARRCTYKAFLGCNPITFNGTEGAVGLSIWIEKLESVFHISKCDNEDKVKYEACTLQGRALTWWNGVSLNLLSRTRKLGHSTMELRSLFS